MSSDIRSITFDCASPYNLAAFWAQVTDFREDPDNDNQPEDPEALLVSPDGTQRLLFVAVPDHKRDKNRVHVDLAPTDRTRDEETDRLLGLGAALVADRRRPDGRGWVVLADPEGNEFCILRGCNEESMRAAT